MSGNKSRQGSRRGTVALAGDPPRGRGLQAIGGAASATGVSAKMIRHYESIGLIGHASRSAGNYRLYGERDLHVLRFIRRARSLGFSMKQIGELLSLWQSRTRRSESVRRIALAHLAALERKAVELQAMAAALRDLAKACHGDARPDCPILEDLAEPARQRAVRA